MASDENSIQDLVYVGLNKRVCAVDRYSGTIVWQWTATKGSGFVSLLLDGDRLMIAVGGYLYCLDPLYGQEVWSNPLKGYGHGIATMTSAHGMSGNAAAAAQIAAQQAAAASSAATTAAATS